MGYCKKISSHSDHWKVRRPLGNGVTPLPKGSIRIDRSDPSFRGGTLDLFQRIIPLCFKNQVARRVGFQPNEKIRNVVVHLTGQPYLR